MPGRFRLLSKPRCSLSVKRPCLSYSLDLYVLDETHDLPAEGNYLAWRSRSHKNMTASGGTGSGKTTLIDAVSGETAICPPNERIVIIEDTGEIQCTAANLQPIAHHQISTNQGQARGRRCACGLIVGEVRILKPWTCLWRGTRDTRVGCATLHVSYCQIRPGQKHRCSSV